MRIYLKTLQSILAILLMLAPMQVLAAVPNQDAQILHLLNRTSFGPTPSSIEAVRQMGFDAYIEQQLHPERFPVASDLQSRLLSLTTTNASLADIVQQYQPMRDEGKLSEEERQELGKRLNTVVFELSEAKILRAIMSPAQLQEVMTDFWFNHFNVFFGKGLDRVLISTYERDAIRPHALGKFRDLLEATARHPAMLFYLDNWQNIDPNSLQARKVLMKQGKELGINENYAREIMELHTLGVNGGYSQQDVTTLAHILTGWGIGRGQDWAGKAMFTFYPERHDFENKIFLGTTIQGGGTDRSEGGAGEVENVLDLLAAHPSTAHHIAYELAQYFVADDPPQSLVSKLTKTFESTDGNIAAVLRTLFYSPEFWDPQYQQVKFKPPFRYVISALRASDAVPPGDTRMVQGAIAGMGEPLYRCQTPNGYANTNDQWLNSDALLKRINIAKSLAHLLNEDTGSMIFNSLGSRNWSADTIKTVQNNAAPLRPVLLLSSPEFLYY